MSTLILIPATKNEENLPKLLARLEGLQNKNPDLTFRVLDLSQTSSSLAEILNAAIREGREENILFLGPQLLPSSQWLSQMLKALESYDLVVGETLTKLPKKANIYGKLAKALLHNHSQRAAEAKGHALPWGPIVNLGITRKLWGKIGHFSPASGNALDIDWCWRAMLQGTQIHFAQKAKAERLCQNDRASLIRDFELYGQGETWLHRSYAFLLSPEDQNENPLESALQAYERIRYHSLASKNKGLQKALEEISVAFASGVRIGYERTHQYCSLERITPGKAIGWKTGKKEITLFVPGKGITTLPAKMNPVWEAYQSGSSIEELAKLMEKIFKFSHHEAHHQVEEFCAAITP